MLHSLLTYLLARFEVRRRLPLLQYEFAYPRDSVRPSNIPSVRAGNWGDRVLADIDQDGFRFARSPLDRSFFDRRSISLPRKRNLLRISLRGGHLCVEKQFLPIHGTGRGTRFWDLVGFRFYLEAAAFLRLRDSRHVPRLLQVDCTNRIISLEYIAGLDLRHKLAAEQSLIYDLDVSAACTEIALLSDQERVDREFRLWRTNASGQYSQPVREMLIEINKLGVIPRDIHLANILIGSQTLLPYMVDFELVCLRPLPGWRARIQRQWALFDSRFGAPASTPK